jgi:hypothetical protein
MSSNSHTFSQVWERIKEASFKHFQVGIALEVGVLNYFKLSQIFGIKA